MDTPIFDALWAKYNSTPIFDRLVEEHEQKKYLELVEPYKYPLYEKRVLSFDEFREYMAENDIDKEWVECLINGRTTGTRRSIFDPLIGPRSQRSTYHLPSHLSKFPSQESATPTTQGEKLMTNNWQRLVNEFRNACDDDVPEFPRTLSPAEAEKHISMIRDEFEKEFVPALLEQNLVEMYDAGIDVLVYVIGALSNAGFDIDPGFKEVMRNNMTKVNPVTGKVVRSRGYELDGEPLDKILKPEGFQPVNLHPIINAQFNNGPEDTTVYRTKGLPLTLGEGGPKVGTADLVMDHNGNITIDAVMDDVDVLPMVEGISIMDVYVPELSSVDEIDRAAQDEYFKNERPIHEQEVSKLNRDVIDLDEPQMHSPTYSDVFLQPRQALTKPASAVEIKKGLTE